ncbi:MAG: HAMP domain-containing sensor histidine kinase [Rhodospirillaceae bacterium]
MERAPPLRLGLRFKVGLCTAGILVVAVLAMVWIATSITDQWTERLGTGLARQLALRYADDLARTLDREKRLARIMVGSPAIRAWIADGDRDPDLRQAALSELDRVGAESQGRQTVATLARPGERYRRYTNLAAEGIDHVVNIAELPRNDVSSWFWEQQAVFEKEPDRETYVTVHEEMPRNVMKVWVNAPYRSGPAVPALVSTGAVFSALDLRAADAPHGHQVMLVDPTGRIRLHEDAAQLGRPAGGLFGLQGLGSPGAGSPTAVIAGMRWFIDVEPVAGMGLNILVAVPDDGNERARTFLPMAVALVGAVTVVLLAAHVGLRRMVVDPVAALRDAASQLTAGRLDVRVPEGRADELGQLASTFNAMAEKLERHTHDLENLVAERTWDAVRERDRADAALKGERAALARYKQFAALVSHEFRNPLAIIKGKSQLMELVAAQGGKPDEQPWDAINRAVIRLQTLFDQWLASETLTEGRFPFLPEPVALAPFLEGVLALAPGQGSHCFELAPLPKELKAAADPSLLRVALLNLLDNAVKYTPGQGTIRLRALEAEGRVVIQVSDDGIGIAPADQARVFERHFRGHMDDGPPGLGLGLFMVREIARLHGGDVAVASTLQVGSTFTLSLPAAG